MDSGAVMANPQPPPGFKPLNMAAPPPPPGFKPIDEGVDFDAGEMISNIPSSLMGVAGDIYNAVRHPIDTGKAVVDLGAAGLEKLGRNFEEFVTGEEIEPAPGKEDAADAVGEFYSNRYGGTDAIKTTAMEDPAGMLFDALGVAFPAGKIPGLSGVSKAASVVEPVNAAIKATKTAVSPIAHLIPDVTIESWYAKSAKFTTTKSDADRLKMVQTALKEKVIPTSKGVDTVNSRIDILNAQINEIISDASRNKTMIPVDVVSQHLDTLRKSKGGFRLGRGDDLADIDKIQAAWLKDLDDLGKEMGGKIRAVTPEQMQKFKQQAYEGINYDAKYQRGSPIKEDVSKAMARGAKDAIADEFPEVARLNERLADLYGLQPHLERSSNRIGNLNPVGLTTPLNISAGSLAGKALGSDVAGMVAGTASAMFNSPKVRARLAVGVKKLKEGDIGWLNANLTRQEIEVAMYLAGQNEQVVNGQ